MENKIKKYIQLLNELLAETSHKFNNFQPRLLPKTPGVYRIFESGSGWGSSVYVGQTKKLYRRIYQNHYLGPCRYSTLRGKLLKFFQTEDQISSYLRAKCSFQFIEIQDKTERNAFEHFAVSVLEPTHND